MTTKDRPLRRQGEATEAKLLDAALTAMSDKGFHATRVDDVVRIAGVSHGTFYLYFGNKEELFRALAESCAEEAIQLAAALPEISPEPEGRDVLREWLAEYLDFYRRHGVVDPWVGREPVRRPDPAHGSGPSRSGASPQPCTRR